MSQVELSSTMSECIIYWQDILGKPEDSSSLKTYVDGKITGLNDDILAYINEQLSGIEEDILNQLRAEIAGVDSIIDPYNIKYNESTVGDTLDTLLDEGFSGAITPDAVFEKGRIVNTYQLSWSFNKPVVKQTITITTMGAPTVTEELDANVRTYDIPTMSNDTSVALVGETAEGSKITLESKIVFKLRMYYGTEPSGILTNENILGLNSLLISKDDYKFGHIFNCQEKDYIYYLFPNDMHMYYTFRTNGMKDNSYLWEVINVTNQYGYMTEYIKFKTPYAFTGTDIQVEVLAHEAY